MCVDYRFNGRLPADFPVTQLLQLLLAFGPRSLHYRARRARVHGAEIRLGDAIALI